MDDMKGGTFTDLQRRRVRQPDVDPDHQPAAVGGARASPDRGPAGRARRPGRHPADDVYRAVSYDHRLIDGREAVTALKIIKDAIEDPTRLLIDLLAHASSVKHDSGPLSRPATYRGGTRDAQEIGDRPRAC